MEEKRQPVIAINMNDESDPNGRGGYSVGQNYVEAVRQAGGLAVLLPPAPDAAAAIRYAELFDGFIFIGGGDISPARYGKRPHPLESPLSALRENSDFALIEAVIAARKPFVAICLGCQEVNVALGGTLIQDIASETSTTIRHSMHQPGVRPLHRVAVENGSRLHNLLGTTEVETNSSHHQAIETPGRGLRVVARTSDGIIEACELEGYPFGLCIQWHPEAMIADPCQLAIFRGLIEAARVAERSGPGR
jgi:putative glutamine amidotransferase